jgi:hypothetical protein
VTESRLSLEIASCPIGTISDTTDVSAVPSRVRGVAPDVSLERSTLEVVAKVEAGEAMSAVFVLCVSMLLLSLFALTLFLFLFLAIVPVQILASSM